MTYIMPLAIATEPLDNSPLVYCPRTLVLLTADVVDHLHDSLKDNTEDSVRCMLAVPLLYTYLSGD